MTFLISSRRQGESAQDTEIFKAAGECSLPAVTAWPPSDVKSLVTAMRNIASGSGLAHGRQSHLDPGLADGVSESDVVPIRPSGHSFSLANRWRDWLRQAERDLEQARASRDEERHEWACFAAHQAAEKAVKALHLQRNQEAWGHVVAKLVSELPREIEVPNGLEDRARVLDKFYVAARNPNGHPEGAPFEHYGPLQSEQALDHARTIIEFVRSQVA